jgi:hypothetical protein
MSERTIIDMDDEDDFSLTLDDGSQWTIDPGDAMPFITWYPSQHVTVRASGNRSTITNLSALSPKEAVRATRIK